jgi:hypothetical protein
MEENWSPSPQKKTYLFYCLGVHHVEGVALAGEPEPTVDRLLVVLEAGVVDEGAVAGVTGVTDLTQQNNN